MSNLLSSDELNKKAVRIRLVALDMDGTLTDGSINIGAEGELFKRFNAKDGLGITAARKHGIIVSVITGRKKQAVLALAEKYSLPLEAIAFMGDDLNDLPAIMTAGLSAAPADAAEDVKERVHWIAPHKGGQGSVRDLLELILKARGLWDTIVKEYMKEEKGVRQ